MNKTIILDTNFLMIPFTLKVDIFEEIKNIAEFKYDLKVIDKTIEELKKIQKDKKLSGRLKNAAKFALTSIKANKIKTIKTKEGLDVDSLILKQAKKSHDKIVVATQDMELKRKLRKLNIPLIILRQKRYLKFQRY